MTIKFTLLFILFSALLSSQTTIRMKRDNGLFKVPCKVNGVKMDFILDTGATSVTISQVEAAFLIKQGLLSDEDIVGRVNFSVADGSISEGLRIRLREIKIEDLILKDVIATVVSSNNSPLLLGQSALSQLGRIEIDDDYLKIYSKSELDTNSFLGIDLTKSIDDFGLSRVNLADAKPVLPIDFKYARISENHFLKSIKFNKQKIVFDDRGNIALIVLAKDDFFEPFMNNNKELKELKNETIKLLNNIYGQPDENNARQTKWSGAKYEINLLEPSSNKAELALFYIVRGSKIKL